MNYNTNSRVSPITLFCSIIILIFLSSLQSCITTKDSYYFKTLKKDTTLSGFVNNDFQSKIRVGDNLSVVATSFSKEEDLLFNQAAGEITSNGMAVSTPGFLVRPDGTVLFHRLGNVPVEGMTRKELALKLQKELLPYMKDPIVNVNYLNHKVTVMGAVVKPQVLNLPEEQLSLIDVLVASGDITEQGKRDEVLIIREENNQKKVKHINLEDHSIFSSPWYYVQPNDIVYVLPNTEKIRKEEKRRNLQSTLALVASGVGLLVIIIDRIIK